MLYLLLDEAHLWGALMARTLEAWDVEYRLVRARELAGGLLSRRPPAALVVPGGFSSRKAACLGQAGLEAVSAYVRAGGAYLGVCGGAGLGLTVPGGLGLCPWTREPFTQRLQHFASGHVHLRPNAESAFAHPGLSGEPLAPVWWPARFRPQGQGVQTVAAYGRPGPDFLMADIPLALVPKQALEEWESLYGVRLSPGFSPGDPCIVSGRAGQGRYVLSHAHLETPQSPEANAWLGHILNELAGVRVPGDGPAPAWDIGQGPPAWDDPCLERAMQAMRQATDTGIDHGLLAWREPWLLGWRQGLPGAQLNGILAMLDHARRQVPGVRGLAYWHGVRRELAETVEALAGELSGYLLAERLALTLWRVDPRAVPERGLRQARIRLFGPPPGAGEAGGGQCGKAQAILEEFVWLGRNLEPDR